MAGLYLGVNDNERSTRSLTSFWRNLRHIGRPENSKDYKYKDDEFINIVEDNRTATKELLRNYKNELKKSDEFSKSDLANSIAKYSYKLKTYEKDLEKLNRDLLFCERDSKEYNSILKKIQKKDKTISTTKEKIETLKIEKDKTINLARSGKNIFNELVFDLTNLDTKYFRNQEFGKLMMKDFIQYVKENFPDMHIAAAACHLDQNGPHIHVAGIYTTGSMFADLKARFGEKDQFKQLQQDFLKYVRESELIKKYDLKINDLKEGEIYLSKQELKLAGLHAKQKTIKDLEKYKTIKDKDEIIKDLRQQLFRTNKALIIEKKKLRVAQESEAKEFYMAKKLKAKLEKASVPVVALENELEKLKNRNLELLKTNANINHLKDDMAQRVVKQLKPLEDENKSLKQAIRDRDRVIKELNSKLQDLEQKENNIDRD